MFGSLSKLRLRRPGDSVLGQLERVRALEHEGCFADALALVDTLLATAPDNIEIVGAKERLAERTGDGPAAIGAWSALIERSPADLTYRLRREMVRLRVGDEREALRELSRLAQAAPTRVDIAEQAARAARWLERSEEALRWFRAACDREPERTDLALEAVRELLRLQRYDEAAAALAALEPQHALDFGFLYLQIIALARRDLGLARTTLATTLERATTVEQIDPLVDLALQFGWHTDAIRHLRGRLARAPGPQVGLHHALDRCLIQAGLPPEAKPSAEGAQRSASALPIADRAARPSTARDQARDAYAFGDFEAAIAAIAPQVDDGGPVALQDARLAIRARIDAERIDEAWAELERHQASFGARDLAEERADLLRADLRLDEELALLRDRVRIDPFDETFASRLADALLIRADADGAARIIETWSQRRPAGRVWAHKRLQLAWSAHRDFPPLVADSQRILDSAPPDLRRHLVMDHVRVLRKSGDFAAADRLLDDFRARVPGFGLADSERLALDSEIAHELTWLGRHAEARPLFDRLLSTPTTQRMRDELMRLACSNESYGGEDLQRFVGCRNAISNPRHHLTVTPFEQASTAPPASRVLVLLHLFHGDLWPDLRGRLAQLDRGAMQLAVGVGDRVSDEVIADLRAFAPSAVLVRVENRGFDVGGHWQLLERVDLREHDLVLVLQTKKSSHTRIGKFWRDHLIDALIGTRARWEDNLRRFAQQPQLGLLGSAWHQSSFHPWSYPEMREVLAGLDMPLTFDALKPVHRFVTGTMFLLRADLLAEMHAKLRDLPFERAEDLSLAKRSDNSRAHAMERAFGMYVAWRGYEACWRP